MNIVIIGASSSIARALALEIGNEDHVILAGRDIDDLEDNAADIGLRTGGTTSIIQFDIADRDMHQHFLDQCIKTLGHVDGIFFCQGVMIDQAQAERDDQLCYSMLDINFSASVLLANRFVQHMRERGTGFLCFLSSVVGDRGRQTLAIYNATKAAINAYVRGLQHRLAGSGVHALLVKPGFVDTAMTWGLYKNNILVSPKRVADDIWRAVRKKKYCIYTPWYWRSAMMFIRGLPRFLFHKIRS